jgi:adenylate cyclase
LEFDGNGGVMAVVNSSMPAKHSYVHPGAKTIMVADDDRTARTVLTQMVRNEGYRAEKCLFQAMEQDIDGFLIDINMPGLSGVDLCHRLRSIERYRVVPIICVTADDKESKLADAFNAGADDFITKPVNAVVLRARLMAQLQKMDYLSEMQRVRDYLNRYVSRRTQTMVEAYSITGVLPAPELQHLTVLFSDFRRFTEISQSMEPTKLFNELSRHLGMQVDSVYRNGDYIDKFAGDGIMAVFDSEGQTEKACRCALEIVRASRPVGGGETDALQLGIGIHAGTALVGNIGSEEHLDYSVIGETVNLAARLCGVAQPMSVVVSSVIVEAVGDDSGFNVTGGQDVKIRGIKDNVTVYNLEAGH